MISSPAFELPDPFRFGDGRHVGTLAQWRARRLDIQAELVPLVYGPLPPAPTVTACIALHSATVRRLADARLLSCRVTADGRHPFSMRVFVPVSNEPCPVVLNGDGCWHYASDEVIASVLRRGYAFAQFNRVEIAPDIAGAGHTEVADQLYPAPACGALAAWAWGYHRAVDALAQLDFADAARIAIVGHSRGGKAALLAGATDERIALTSANNSGAGGAGSFRILAPGAETLDDITRAFPQWFGPTLRQYARREEALPFDQHFLKALIAPRALLTTEAHGDLWANPSGSWQTHLAAREVYRFLGAEARMAIAFRDGGHDHGPADWTALLDFCDTVFRGAPRPSAWDADPFPDLPKTFAWRHPPVAE